jgi:hypothetical protein
MFGTAADRLAAALAAYERNFAARIKDLTNVDAESARAIVREANTIVRESGLGTALAPTLIEHVKHWPTWCKRDDFQDWVGFPATSIYATAEKRDKEEVLGVLFTYNHERYWIRFSDEGTTWLPDGTADHGGKVDFLWNGDAVLGVSVFLESGEFGRWCWRDVHIFKVGEWAKDLLEIAAHIKKDEGSAIRRRSEHDAIERAKSIRLR